MGLSSTFKNIARIGIAPATGGLSEVGFGMGGSGPLNFLAPNKETVRNDPLQTPEQAAASRFLLDFMKTGKLGDFNLGEEYKGSLGDFNPTDIENASMGRLSSYLAGGRPGIYDTGEKTLQDLLGEKFDPYSATGEFAPFKADLERNLAEGAGRIKANAAFSGNLYSKNTGKQMGLLEERGQNALQGKLAQLYTDYVNRKASLAPQALNFATTKNALDLAPIEAGLSYGGFTRNLKNQGSSAMLSDYLRRRSEMLMPIQAAGTILGSPVQFGPSEVSTYTPSPWMDLLKTGLNLGTTYLGARS